LRAKQNTALVGEESRGAVIERQEAVWIEP